MPSRPPVRPVILPAVLAAAAFMACGLAPAEAAKWKPKQQSSTAHRAAPSSHAAHGGAVDGTTSELPTGALGASGPGGETIGKDCFVVKKRALVPGTGYVIRRSTFCN